jgi:hypothetical protein
VDGFGLYPGTPEQPGLSVSFSPGLTLILGTNGLGKSTLIQILYRCLTGPYDIPGLDTAAELGNMKTAATMMAASRRNTFASRDALAARGSEVTFTCEIGSRAVSIRRRLSDLALLEFVVDEVTQVCEEIPYQQSVVAMVGLSSFGDFILMLRHLIFYFEDRRSLIWDRTAQRQLLRLLFLPPQQAARWISDERAVLELDSRMRNLRSILGSEEQKAKTHSDQAARSTDVRGELTTLDLLQATDSAKREELDPQSSELDAFRQAQRLRHLQLQQEHESNQREYERAKLAAIRSRFPSTDDTSAFILARLISDAHCLVCGNHAPDAAVEEYNDRIRQVSCVICGTDLRGEENRLSGAEFADAAMSAISSRLDFTSGQLQASQLSLAEAEGAYSSCIAELARLDASISERSLRIEVLLRQLPPEDSERRQQLSELSLLRRRLEESRSELNDKIAAFSTFVDSENRAIQEASERIKVAFTSFATGFLLETCSLIWAPYSSRVGQSGEPMLFPAFGLEMSGSNFSAPTRRDGPDQVSESQREFIDLAFRMALMKVASQQSGASTLVIDAPESSLDAIFAQRAKDVLARFSTSESGNRLIVTSNLITGELLPGLLRECFATGEEAASHVVNLLEIAAPTAAVKELRAEYDAVYNAIVQGAFAR